MSGVFSFILIVMNNVYQDKQMQKRKNRPETQFERFREHFLNTLDDLIFLQNVDSPIGFRHIMGLIYVLVVALFLFVTVTAFLRIGW